MPTYIGSQAVVLHDLSVRPGNSPGDLIAVYVPGVVLVSNQGTIDVAPYVGHAEVFGYTCIRRATSSYSAGANTLTVDCRAAGSTDTVDFIIWIKANQTQ